MGGGSDAQVFSLIRDRWGVRLPPIPRHPRRREDRPSDHLLLVGLRRAGSGTRTRNRPITSRVRYQLRHASVGCAPVRTAAHHDTRRAETRDTPSGVFWHRRAVRACQNTPLERWGCRTGAGQLADGLGVELADGVELAAPLADPPTARS